MHLYEQVAIYNRYSHLGTVTVDHPGPAALSADDLHRAALAVVNDGLEAGAAVLEPFAYPPFGPIQLKAASAQRSLSTKQRADARVLQRDGFRCRYCGGQLVIRAAHELFATLYPNIYPYHSHGKLGYYHPAQWWLEYGSDHVLPRARGGPDADDNRVAACWWHNDQKRDLDPADYLSTHELKENLPSWSGLTDLYPAMWRTAGRPDADRHRKHADFWSTGT